jgi:hypothetical protein
MGIAENIASLTALQQSDPFAYNFYYGGLSPNAVALGNSQGVLKPGSTQ